MIDPARLRPTNRMHDADPMPTAPTLDHRRFALANAGVWVAYGVLNGLLFMVFAGPTTGMAAIAVLLAIGGYLVTTALRRIAQAGGWLDAGTWALAWRLALAVLVGAAIVQVIVAGGLLLMRDSGLVRFPGDGRGDFRPVAMLGYWLNTVFLLGVWCVLWLGARATRRGRRAELARLHLLAERHALELDALRARLNPHFVFNALNNLRALINEDTERARELVTRLSNTLRHALEHHASDVVTLGEELAVVEDYLAVEAVHYEDRLQVRWDIAPAARSLRLPPMLVQLLVENAIKHGIGRTPGGGVLQIGARVGAGALVVEVDNPGTLDATLQPRDAGGAPGGVGLAYLRARLASDPRHAFALVADCGRVRATMTIAQEPGA